MKKTVTKRAKKQPKNSKKKKPEIKVPTWCHVTDEQLSKMQSEADQLPTTFQLTQIAARFITKSDFIREEWGLGPNPLQVAAKNAMDLFFICKSEMETTCSEWQDILSQSKLEQAYQKLLPASKKVKNKGNTASILVTRDMFLKMQLPQYRTKPDELRNMGIKFASFIKRGKGLSLLQTYDNYFEANGRRLYFNPDKKQTAISRDEEVFAYEEWEPIACSDERLLLLTKVFEQWKRNQISQIRSISSNSRWKKTATKPAQ